MAGRSGTHCHKEGLAFVVHRVQLAPQGTRDTVVCGPASAAELAVPHSQPRVVNCWATCFLLALKLRGSSAESPANPHGAVAWLQNNSLQALHNKAQKQIEGSCRQDSASYGGNGRLRGNRGGIRSDISSSEIPELK